MQRAEYSFLTLTHFVPFHRCRDRKKKKEKNSKNVYLAQIRRNVSRGGKGMGGREGGGVLQITKGNLDANCGF